MRRPNQSVLKTNYRNKNNIFGLEAYLLSRTEGLLFERILDSLTTDGALDTEAVIKLIEYRKKNNLPEGTCACCGADIDTIGESAYIRIHETYRSWDDPPEQEEPFFCSAACEKAATGYLSLPRSIGSSLHHRIDDAPIWFEIEAVINPVPDQVVSDIRLLASCNLFFNQVKVDGLLDLAKYLIPKYVPQMNITEPTRAVLAFRTLPSLAYKVWQVVMHAASTISSGAVQSYSLLECPACKGTGRELCTNPDPGEEGCQTQEGCPACGQDPLRRTSEPCPFCEGQGSLAVPTSDPPLEAYYEADPERIVVFNEVTTNALVWMHTAQVLNEEEVERELALLPPERTRFLV